MQWGFLLFLLFALLAPLHVTLRRLERQNREHRLEEEHRRRLLLELAIKSGAVLIDVTTVIDRIDKRTAQAAVWQQENKECQTNTQPRN